MHGILARLIHLFGAAGVGLGAGLEGETAVVIGGVLARHDAFTPMAAWIAAWIGSFVADQIFFGLGRWQRHGRLVERIAAKPAFARALAFVDRHPVGFCIAFRFIYGFRVAGPVAVGVSHVPARLFVLLNFITAAVWAGCFTLLGYRFGRQVEALLRRIYSPAHLAIAAACILLVGAGLYFWRRSRMLNTGRSVP